MSDFKNPFSGLTRREYNITNLKKVLDTFPTSLQTRQLTSNELLERLEDVIQDRNIRIDELLAQLANRSAVSSDINDINDQLGNLTDSLDLENFVEETTEDTEREARIQALKGEGYVQLGNTPLYILVDTNPSEQYEFYMDHTDENGAGINPGDLKSPRAVKFANVSKTDSVWFMKEERWTTDEDGFASPTRFGRTDASWKGVTNVFKFTDFKNAHTTAYEIKPDSNASTTVELHYTSKDAYKNAGLKRDGATNTWFGFMDIFAKVGSSSNVYEEKATDVGKMKLYRDRT